MLCTDLERETQLCAVLDQPVFHKCVRLVAPAQSHGVGACDGDSAVLASEAVVAQS